MYSLTDNPICVYGIFDKSNPERIRYVGLTTVGIKRRFSSHWSQATYTDRKLPILLWMRKREQSQVGIVVLESHSSIDDVKAAEIRLIAHYRSIGQADLNITDGGEAMNGHIHSEAWRREHSQRMLGENNPMYGKNRSSEFMAWVKSHDTKPMTEAQVLARRENIKATKSPEALKKLSESLRDTLSTPEHKSRMRSQVLGSKNPMAKLGEGDIRTIRLLRAGGLDVRTIASRFGISSDYVYRICGFKAWSHIV